MSKVGVPRSVADYSKRPLSPVSQRYLVRSLFICCVFNEQIFLLCEKFVVGGQSEVLMYI